MRNIRAEIQNHQLKRTKREERNELWNFIGLSVIGYVGYVLLACF